MEDICYMRVTFSRFSGCFGMECLKWVESKSQIADVLTKKGVNTSKILNALELGSLPL